MLMAYPMSSWSNITRKGLGQVSSSLKLTVGRREARDFQEQPICILLSRLKAGRKLLMLSMIKDQGSLSNFATVAGQLIH
jgi:hypothetical protein